MEEKQPTLWTMNTDGTERTRLTAIGTSSWTPLWSPNGKTLAFLSTANDGKVNLYVVPKGSTKLVQLTSWDDMKKPDSSMHQTLFTWSPKSDQIVYGYKNQVWLVQLDTLEQSTLVTVDPAYSIESVAWAPHRENKYIAYTVRKGANYYSVMLVNPRLKDNLTLIDAIKSVPSISWSSGAEKIAYVSGNKTLYTTTLEESSPKVVINNASPDLGPFVAYSPVEGAAKLLLLAKQSTSDIGYKVAIVDLAAKTDQDTGTLKYLTPDGVEFATWSPDSTKIAYVISGELWIMESGSGLNKTRIALTGIQSPDWSKK
jgi:Tol biopolymer transport system component